MWAITDGKSYISGTSHSQSTTGDLRLARKFDTSQKASNFMVNIKRTYKTFNWQVVEIAEEKPVAKKVEYKLNNAVTYKEPTIFESEQFSWDKQINNIELFFTQMNSYKSSLERKIKIVDRELCDIDHAIEFAEKANGVQGFNLFKLERKKLKERRHIKDELMRIGIIQDSNLDDIHNGRISKRLSGIDTRMYAPRELPELFTEKYIVM